MADTRRFPGFDGIRLAAATSVIFSHAFLIATGSEDNEPFVRFLGLDSIIGLYGVFTFFIISGFLLARSLRSNPSLSTYAVNRILRILPAFVVSVLITALLIGPLCSSLSVTTYFSSRETWSFLVTSLNSFADATLPGVFNYGSDLASVVNGSLWSLRYEALSYVFLLAIWISVRSSTVATAGVATVALLTWVLPSVSALLPGIAYTLPYFGAGVAMQWVHERYGSHAGLAALSMALLVAAAFLGFESYAFAPAGAYVIVFLGERSNPGSTLARKIGDCSYGLYLYGWPVEQMVRQFTQTTSPAWLLVGAFPIAFALALVSCHVVEQPAMRWRTSVAAAARRGIAWVFRRTERPAITGARVAYALGATLLLLSQDRWWFFLEGMSEVALGMALGSLIVAAVFQGRLRVR